MIPEWFFFGPPSVWGTLSLLTWLALWLYAMPVKRNGALYRNLAFKPWHFERVNTDLLRTSYTARYDSRTGTVGGAQATAFFRIDPGYEGPNPVLVVVRHRWKLRIDIYCPTIEARTQVDRHLKWLDDKPGGNSLLGWVKRPVRNRIRFIENEQHVPFQSSE